MDMETPRLLTEIRSFLRESGMSPSYFGQQAAGNSELVRRLEAGGTVTLPVAERVRSYISNPREREKARRLHIEKLARRQINELKKSR